MHRPGIFKKYAYAWITAGFFLGALVLHWLFGWYAYQAAAAQHGEAGDAGGYLVEMMRDTMENWQSEFLQLLWQVGGLAYFLYVGSPASKENDDRLEAKVDALIRIVGGAEGAKLIDDLDAAYLRTHGHAQPHAHASDLARRGGADLTYVAAR
jgi:hypothetical protein